MHVAARLVSLGTAVVLAAGLAPSATAAVHFRSDRLARPHGPAPPVTRLLVQFRRDTSSARLKQIVQRAGGKLGQRLRLVRAAAVGRRSGVSLEELRARLRNSDRVLRVEDDASIQHREEPQRPRSREQYAIKQKDDHDIDAPAAWDKRTSCAKVAVLDTGVQSNHPDLKGNLWENTKDPSNGKDDDHNGVIDDRWGGDVVDGKGSGDDEQGHGTHVAGIIGAKGNNKKGVTGLCWSVKIIAVRVMNSNGYGTWSQGIAGLDYALAAGAKVVNCLLRRDQRIGDRPRGDPARQEQGRADRGRRRQ